MPLARARRSLESLRNVAKGAVRLAAPPLVLPHALARELFISQLHCRIVDIEAHELRARNEGYYTIASAGHEGNVALGHLTRSTDPALLHYRSGAFFIARARAAVRASGMAQGGDPPGIFELLLSLAASADDPISGGRHKVFGSVPWGIPPQTSTIASHLPKAVGMAVAIDRSAKLRVHTNGTNGIPAAGTVPTTRDSIVICSFGDASLNHSTAQGAINAASWAAYQRVPVPVLFVCEDNGLGVSVRTPPGWVEARMRGMPCVAYIAADGSNLSQAYEATERAVAACRKTRAPVFLHLRCERVWGHAGSDADAEYRAATEVAAAEQRDPVLLTAQSLLEAGAMTSVELLATIDNAVSTTTALSRKASLRPKLRTREAVMDAIAPPSAHGASAEARAETRAETRVLDEARRAGYAAAPADANKPKALAHAIRMGLADLMRKYPEMLMFGEDVAEKGGVYGVTVGLWKTFGAGRVFNTLLDEQTILGFALGASQIGLLPVPEIQFLAYLHNAEDQLRGEAATLSFFSRGQLKNPMVVRIAGLGYQKGFGGHFHNDDSLAVLRDLPGVLVAAPSRGDDAVMMLRTLLAAAKIDGRVCVFVEPIALYHTRDLFSGDGAWSFPFPEQGRAIAVGEVGVYGEGARDLVMFTYANGVPMCLRVARALEEKGIHARVIDLRWIAPLPEDAILRHAYEARAVLVVDECRRSGNVSEGISALLLGAGDAELRAKPFARVTSADSFIPLAEAANLVLVQEAEILEAAQRLAPKEARAARQRDETDAEQLR
ncbi:transketolase C-terminal domain-containing protein [Pendulispora albinea]|uniref:3-methyl-2-oxobutanoate dehydrogenase (2-methylpropanoyl-transferring) n=1 Tax=Pendulispora albinea TaxID=2741071 RepID=A0ABZ2M4D7_9BACT